MLSLFQNKQNLPTVFQENCWQISEFQLMRQQIGKNGRIPGEYFTIIVNYVVIILKKQKSANIGLHNTCSLGDATGLCWLFFGEK